MSFLIKMRIVSALLTVRWQIRSVWSLAGVDLDGTYRFEYFYCSLASVYLRSSRLIQTYITSRVAACLFLSFSLALDPCQMLLVRFEDIDHVIIDRAYLRCSSLDQGQDDLNNLNNNIIFYIHLSDKCYINQLPLYSSYYHP